jgi:predicted nuclease with TOPRIM domain
MMTFDEVFAELQSISAEQEKLKERLRKMRIECSRLNRQEKVRILERLAGALPRPKIGDIK